MALAATHERVALIVESDLESMSSAVRVLQGGGFITHQADSHAAALEYASSRPPDCAVVASVLSDGPGLDVVRDLADLVSGIRIVVTTDYASIRCAVQAIRLGAFDYLLKPLHPEELLCAVDPQRPSSATKRETPFMTLEDARWEYINQVLSHCDGNISETARLLGLHRQSLQRMLRRQRPRR